MNFKGKQRRNQATTVNIFEQQELMARAEVIRNNLKASIWHELETKGSLTRTKSSPSSVTTCL